MDRYVTGRELGEDMEVAQEPRAPSPKKVDAGSNPAHGTNSSKKPDASYRVWLCSYYWIGKMGAYQCYECIVVAEIESKAIGMALMAYPNTDASDWSASEIPIDKEGVHRISDQSN